MKKLTHLLLFICLFLITSLNLNAAVDFTKNSDSLILKSQIYIDTNATPLEQIKNDANFTNPKVKNINLGFVRDTTLWIRLEFYNPSDKELTKVLQIRNPLLESVVLFDGNSSTQKGTLNQIEPKDEIHTSFELTLKPQELKRYYLKVDAKTTALRLNMNLQDIPTYLKAESKEQIIIFVFLSTLTLMLVYNLILYFYTKERAYLYYVLYLFTLIYQQLTYLGVTQMFFPAWFVHYDNLSVVLKVNLMFITAILFAKSFLQTQNYQYIHKIYNTILIAALIEIPLFGTPWFYIPEIAIVTALLFIFFNMYAGIYIYRQGYLQARFFIIGWAFQLIGFSMMILDGLGLISVMNYLPDIVMFFTSIEAIVLSLAFIDRYAIYKKEKEEADAKLFQELNERQNIIEAEITKATAELNKSLYNEKTLLKELHHRIKNNLQLILSLVRMQADTLDEKSKDKFKNLVGRINSISKTHSMLFRKDNLEKIDIGEYVEELCSDLKNLSNKNVLFEIEIQNMSLSVGVASYIGLIINELVTNSLKYVAKEKIVIEIRMYEENGEYFLSLKDNGEGFEMTKQKRESLGLKIVKTLVENQLDGVFEIKHESGFLCKMEFKI